MNLIPRMVLGDVDLTDYPFAVEFGSDFGTAQNIVQVIQSGLDDGEIQRVTGKTNRTFDIPLLVESSDLLASALAEKLLAAECDKERNEFRVDPGDGFAPVTVFQTYQGEWGFQRDDNLEINGYRRFRLTFQAHPFGFSEDEVVDVAVEAPPVTPVTVVMASGVSATGWTSPDGPVTSDGDELLVSAGAPTSSFDNYGTTVYYYVDEATFAFSPVDFTATRYISAELELRGAAQYSYSSVAYIYGATVDGIDLQLASTTYVGNGKHRLTWMCSDSNATTLRIRAAYYVGATGSALGFKISNVTRSNVVAGLPMSTGRQSLRTLAITGSARTAGSIAVSHASQGLGDVLLYTSPDLAGGYNPDITPYLSATGSTVTADPTTISGQYITATKKFDVDAKTLPEGPYLVMLRMSSDGALTPSSATVHARSFVGATEFAEESLPQFDIPPGLEMATYAAGVMTLPLTKFPAESQGTLQIEVGSSGSRLDKVWLFYIGDDADLTHVRAGFGAATLGTAHSNVFLDAASLQNEGRPGLFVGTKSDRSDAFHPGYPAVQSFGRHPLAPPTVNLFIVTTGAANPTVTLRHRPAWFTHAGQ